MENGIIPMTGWTGELAGFIKCLLGHGKEYQTALVVSVPSVSIPAEDGHDWITVTGEPFHGTVL